MRKRFRFIFFSIHVLLLLLLLLLATKSESIKIHFESIHLLQTEGKIYVHVHLVHISRFISQFFELYFRCAKRIRKIIIPFDRNRFFFQLCSYFFQIETCIKTMERAMLVNEISDENK